MRRGSHRWLRAAITGAALIASTAACQIDVTLTTTVARDGSGTFSVSFVADKELIDLARASGEDPFAALAEFPSRLPAGWRYHRSEEGGGLAITLERRFSSASDLNDALDALERAASDQGGPTARFFRLRLERSSSFLRTRTKLSGSIDLTSNGLLGATNLPPDSLRQLQSLIEQTGPQFFLFTMRANLPGKIGAATGNPQSIDGGTVTWSPRLGQTLALGAESSATNPVALGAIGIPVAAVAALLLGTFLRRRRAPEIVPLEATLDEPPHAEV